MKVYAHYFLIALFLATAVLFGVTALVPQWRTSMQNAVISDQRKVLATVYGRLIPDFDSLKAVKSIDKEGVFVEIFKASDEGSLTLVKEIRTGHPHDGQFNFKGHMSRLVAADLDQDGIDELLVPTFDEMQRPRLNVYKYQAGVNEFQEISPTLPVQ